MIVGWLALSLAWAQPPAEAPAYEPWFAPPTALAPELEPEFLLPAPPPVEPEPAPAPPPAAEIVAPPRASLLQAFWWATVAVGAFGAVQVMALFRDRVRADGLLAPVIGLLHGLFAAGGVLAVAAAAYALLPVRLGPLIPVLAVGAAIAVGWAARDVLRDVIAGVMMRLEHRVTRGQVLRADGHRGTVEAMGLRALWLRDAAGRLVSVPNHVLLSIPIVADGARWPVVEIEIAGPSGPDGRQAIEEAVLVSPWVSPSPELLVREAAAPGRWLVRVRLIEARFAERFEGALRERARELEVA